MRKTIFLLLCSVVIAGIASAQKAPADHEPGAVLVTDIKSELVTKLKLSAASADKIVAIEKQYAEKLAAVKAMRATPAREKERMREIQMERRDLLSAVPLKPRQVEEVIMIVENNQQNAIAK